jgi:acetyltransferase-like isoleucine patch superfamily enzyme
MKPFRIFLIYFIIPFIPETRGFALKRALFRFAGVKVGKNVRICSSTKIRGNGILQIGDNTWVGHGAHIISTSLVKIGSNVDIAPNVYIGTGTHKIDVKGTRVAGEGVSKDVHIGNGTWLCTGAIVLPGTVLGNMCIAAAGSVINATFESYSLLGGLPAKYIKDIKA